MAKSGRAGTPTDLTAAQSVDTAIVAILTERQTELVATLRATLDRPAPDEVHALRVALRRLRAALALCGRWVGADVFKALRSDAHDLAAALGRARDWDVLVTETLPRHADELAGVANLSALIEEANAARNEGYRQMLARLDGPLPQKLLLGLALLLAQPPWRAGGAPAPKRLADKLKPRAARELSRAQRRQKRHGKRITELSDEERHRVRIDAKRLGYTIDFLGPVWPKRRKRHAYRAHVKSLQTALGALNDLRTTRRLLDQIAAETPSPAVHQAVGAVLGWSARDKREQLEALGELWRRFRSTKPFW
ncbi:CHAD domain-containing protein [Kaistia sp. 32K]|uniref:CHAD domain-containing protein n=1 Tax=Kaistia sp. 32K TaxID=2795690 RepID=UPI001914F599|nr:CHAD domain-containing protein [Kaistia sp. 32K]